MIALLITEQWRDTSPSGWYQISSRRIKVEKLPNAYKAAGMVFNLAGEQRGGKRGTERVRLEITAEEK